MTRDSNQSSTVKRQNHILWRLSKVIGTFNNVFVQLTFVFIDLLISSLFVQEIYFILCVTCYVNKNDYLVQLEWKRIALPSSGLKGIGLQDRIQIFWQKWMRLGLNRNLYCFLKLNLCWAILITISYHTRLRWKLNYWRCLQNLEYYFKMVTPSTL